DGRVGQAYDETITVGNNQTPVLRFSIQNGFLPSGLNIALVSGSSNQGRISGTPLVAGRFSFEVVAQCVGTNVSGQQGSQAYTITVTCRRPLPRARRHGGRGRRSAARRGRPSGRRRRPGGPRTGPPRSRRCPRVA